MCVYEFREKGACRRQGQCKFEHSITEQQRNDPVLKEEIKKRLLSIQNIRRTTQLDTTERAENNTFEVRSLLEQMYNLLQNSSQSLCF